MNPFRELQVQLEFLWFKVQGFKDVGIQGLRGTVADASSHCGTIRARGTQGSIPGHRGLRLRGLGVWCVGFSGLGFSGEWGDKLRVAEANWVTGSWIIRFWVLECTVARLKRRSTQARAPEALNPSLGSCKGWDLDEHPEILI